MNDIALPGSLLGIRRKIQEAERQIDINERDSIPGACITKMLTACRHRKP